MESDEERDNQNQVENARIGYQTAITLWTYEGQLSWNRTGAMVTANSVIVAALGFLVFRHPDLSAAEVFRDFGHSQT